MKKLLFARYRFYTENNKYIFDNINDQNKIKLFLSVIELYKPPSHVDPVYIYEYNTIEDYDKGLIYVGYDKNNYLQYFYGKDYVNGRSIKRDNIIKKMVKNIDKYTTIIKSFLNKTNMLLYNFACILLLELNFFIRTGKSEYETIGLLTLKNSNIIKNKDNILISFVGKKQVSHKFTLTKDNSVYKHIDSLITKNKTKKASDLFFDISESAFYNTMKSNFDGVRLKDFRTYGVNKIFVETLRNVNLVKNTKKTIMQTLESTASTIGHTRSICKSSYLSKYLYDKLSSLDTDSLVKLIKTIKKSKNPIEYLFFTFLSE